MEPLFVLHIRLASLGVIPWSVFSKEALAALVRAIDDGEFGPASIVELEPNTAQLPEAA
jgi:hypothetical protein